MTAIEQLKVYIGANLPYPALDAWINTLNEEDKAAVENYLEEIYAQAEQVTGGGSEQMARLGEAIMSGLAAGLQLAAIRPTVQVFATLRDDPDNPTTQEIARWYGTPLESGDFFKVGNDRLWMIVSRTAACHPGQPPHLFVLEAEQWNTR